MNRRDALWRVAAMMGGTLSAPTLIAVMEGCKPEAKTENTVAEKFPSRLANLVEEAADTIIPTTSTPGAKAAGVGPFIVTMMSDCYPEKDRQHFLTGLESLDKAAKDTYSNNFTALKPNERTELLKKIETEVDAQRKKDKQEAEKKKNQPQAAQTQSKEEEEPLPHYFTTLKELTLLGYFTSEPGATQALAYLPVPGRYEGCTTLEPGQKAWSL